MKLTALGSVLVALVLAACGEERQLPERFDAPPAVPIDARIRVDARDAELDAPVGLADAAPGTPDGAPGVDASPATLDAGGGTLDARRAVDAAPGTPDAARAIDAPPAPIDAPPSPPDAGPILACGDHVTQPPEQCDDGNIVTGDGCEPDCTLTVAEQVACRTLPPLAQGVCEVTAGGDAKLIEGDVLTPGRIFRGGQVAVDATGTIVCVGCDCSASAAGATLIRCPRGAISPGLINPHDHITFTQNAPFHDTGERYEQRHDWRSGIRGHTRISTAGNASGDQISWGEMRQLIGGTTSPGAANVLTP